MSNTESIGILGIGTYLPPEVRGNDWWPDSVVARWREKRAAPLDERNSVGPQTEGGRAVAQAMAALRDDPFHGARERRVMADGVRASDMEVKAARLAIEKAGIDPAEIGVVLCNTLAPDYLVTNNACLLHHNLGLSPRCFAMATEAGCNAFLMQLALAQQMLRGNYGRYALIVQTCNISPLLDTSQPHSAFFGDGCAATIVGPVGPGRGILSQATRTEGEYHEAIVAGVPGKRWFEDGAVRVYTPNHEVSRRSFLGIADRAEELVGAALKDAHVSAADVDFFAPHQAMSWTRTLLEKRLALPRARSIDTFSWAASMFAVNIPVALDMAEREGLLRPDDLLLTFSAGAGLTYMSSVLRWGR